MYGIYGKKENFTQKEKALINAYRNNPNMQSAVDKLLMINEPNLTDDMKSTIEKVASPTKQK